MTKAIENPWMIVESRDWREYTDAGYALIAQFGEYDIVAPITDASEDIEAGSSEEYDCIARLVEMHNALIGAELFKRRDRPNPIPMPRVGERMTAAVVDHRGRVRYQVDVEPHEKQVMVATALGPNGGPIRWEFFDVSRRERHLEGLGRRPALMRRCQDGVTFFVSLTVAECYGAA